MAREIKFGRNLKILRTKMGWSQQDLAERIHLTRQSISIWERNEGKPDIYCLSDICELYGVSADDMLYSNMLEFDVTARHIDEEILLQTPVYETIDYIKSIDEKGLYTITDEDLMNFFEIIDYSFVRILVIALALKERGYIVTEVFDNGFTVVMTDDKQAAGFWRVLYDIVDAFIHHDDKFIEEKTKELSADIDIAMVEGIDRVMTELHGGSIYEFAYYWLDAFQNPRGYANSEEECRKQAELQGCNEYVILKNA